MCLIVKSKEPICRCNIQTVAIITVFYMACLMFFIYHKPALDVQILLLCFSYFRWYKCVNEGWEPIQVYSGPHKLFLALLSLAWEKNYEKQKL